MADQTSKPGNGNTTSSSTVTPGLAGAGTGTGSMGTESRSSLNDVRSHLGKAATAAGDSLRGASRAAREELRTGTDGLRSELGEVASASRAAAYEVRDVADEKLQEAMEHGREFLDSAERMIREKPLQAIGIAALAGFLIAKLR